MRLNNSEWLPFAPDDPGTIRINHNSASCSGASKSLKITRTDDDRVYAKCYRCGGFGSYMGSLSGFSGYAKRVGKAWSGKVGEVHLPSDFTNQIMDFPIEVKVKLKEYFISQDEINDYGLGWSERMQRFIFPVFRDKEFHGYQARYWGDDEKQPKYITRYKNDSDLWTYLPTDGSHSGSGIVIVEDMFSAIRCSKTHDTVCLMGTEMGDKCLDKSSTEADDFLVFLDDDNLIVKKKAVLIRDRLTMVGKRVNIYTSGGKDPKEIPPKELRDILTTYLPKR